MVRSKLPAHLNDILHADEMIEVPTGVKASDNTNNNTNNNNNNNNNNDDDDDDDHINARRRRSADGSRLSRSASPSLKGNPVLFFFRSFIFLSLNTALSVSVCLPP